MNNQPIIVAITGASGIIYGVTLLKALRHYKVPTILVTSQQGLITLKYELNLTPKELHSLADEHFANTDIAASIASGGLKTRGMVIAPCSVKTLSAVANCYSNNLISRAADVTLKEQRKLILMFREAPLHVGHINLMQQAALSEATIMPPVPVFYNQPKTIEDIVNASVSKVLDLFNIENDLTEKWKVIK